jgi:hypothetical protein
MRQQHKSQLPNKHDVVEFMRQILQPSYNAGLLPAEQFADIVREVSTSLFFSSGNNNNRKNNWKEYVREKIAELFQQQSQNQQQQQHDLY